MSKYICIEQWFIYTSFIHSLVLFPWTSQFSSTPLPSGEAEKCKYSFLLCLGQNNSSCRILILFLMVFQEALSNCVWSHASSSHSQSLKIPTISQIEPCWIQILAFYDVTLDSTGPLPWFSLSFCHLEFNVFISWVSGHSHIFATTESTSPWPAGIRATPGDCHIYLPLCVPYKVCGFSAWNGNGMISKAFS